MQFLCAPKGVQILIKSRIGMEVVKLVSLRGKEPMLKLTTELEFRFRTRTERSKRTFGDISLRDGADQALIRQGAHAQPDDREH